jgi:REP element-mobilizing transposase RayT
MRLPERKLLPHDLPSFVRTDEAVFFLTICCEPRGQNQLCAPEAAKSILESIAFLHDRGDWYVHYALLMPDHIHALASFPSDKPMQRVVADWKKFIARNCGIRWQRDFFDHRLRSDESLREKADYIAMNPVRKGLVERMED